MMEEHRMRISVTQNHGLRRMLPVVRTTFFTALEIKIGLPVSLLRKTHLIAFEIVYIAAWMKQD